MQLIWNLLCQFQKREIKELSLFQINYQLNMVNNQPDHKHAWTKTIRKKFNLFIKESNPSFQECREFLKKSGLELSETNLKYAAGIYIFEKYDARLTVEEIKEMVEDEISSLN